MHPEPAHQREEERHVSLKERETAILDDELAEMSQFGTMTGYPGKRAVLSRHCSCRIGYHSQNCLDPRCSHSPDRVQNLPYGIPDGTLERRRSPYGHNGLNGYYPNHHPPLHHDDYNQIRTGDAYSQVEKKRVYRSQSEGTSPQQYHLTNEQQPVSPPRRASLRDHTGPMYKPSNYRELIYMDGHPLRNLEPPKLTPVCPCQDCQEKAVNEELNLAAAAFYGLRLDRDTRPMSPEMWSHENMNTSVLHQLSRNGHQAQPTSLFLPGAAYGQHVRGHHDTSAFDFDSAHPKMASHLGHGYLNHPKGLLDPYQYSRFPDGRYGQGYPVMTAAHMPYSYLHPQCPPPSFCSNPEYGRPPARPPCQSPSEMQSCQTERCSPPSGPVSPLGAQNQNSRKFSYETHSGESGERCPSSIQQQQQQHARIGVPPSQDLRICGDSVSWRDTPGSLHCHRREGRVVCTPPSDASGPPTPVHTSSPVHATPSMGTNGSGSGVLNLTEGSVKPSPDRQVPRSTEKAWHTAEVKPYSNASSPGEATQRIAPTSPRDLPPGTKSDIPSHGQRRPSDPIAPAFFQTVAAAPSPSSPRDASTSPRTPSPGSCQHASTQRGPSETNGLSPCHSRSKLLTIQETAPVHVNGSGLMNSSILNGQHGGSPGLSPGKPVYENSSPVQHTSPERFVSHTQSCESHSLSTTVPASRLASTGNTTHISFNTIRNQSLPEKPTWVSSSMNIGHLGGHQESLRTSNDHNLSPDDSPLTPRSLSAQMPFAMGSNSDVPSSPTPSFPITTAFYTGSPHSAPPGMGGAILQKAPMDDPQQPPLPEKRHLPTSNERSLSMGGTEKNSTLSRSPGPSHHVTFSLSESSPLPSDAVRENQLNVKFVQDTSRFWYKPNISRDQAIALLKDKEPGFFLIRDSNSFQGAYGLALKVATPPANAVSQPGKGDPTEQLVRHFLIETGPKGVKIKGSPNEPHFGSLSALVSQHSITPISLPCRLRIPSRDPMEESQEVTVPANLSTAADLLRQGAACSVLFLTSVETESLTGPQAVSRAVGVALTCVSRPTACLVHFKVSAQGITLTDNQRKLFFRRHYPVSSVTYCSTDPQDRRWANHDGTTSKVFGFVAKKPGSVVENVCHLFAELDPEQPASAIVNFITKVMLGTNRR